MAEEVLHNVADLDGFSFYGLSHHLSEVQRLLERADHARVAKAPRPEDAAIAEQQDNLLDAQARLRRAMGTLLEKPSLTKREKPLAQDFLEGQLSRLEAQPAGEAKAAKAKAVERLRQLLTDVRASTPVPESREVRQVEASIKQLETEWKEVSPLYDKWQAGRHNFKSNSDLQAFRRRYEDCKKGREGSEARLHKALCTVRTGKAVDEPGEQGLAPGWSAVAKKAATTQPASRGLAAPTQRPAAATRTRPGRWGSAVVSFAQRLRAEVGARVRDEVEAEKDTAGTDGGFWDEEVVEEEAQAPTKRPAPPPPPPPKGTPAAAAKRSSPPPAAEEPAPSAAAAAKRPSPAPGEGRPATTAARRPPPPPVPQEEEEEELEEEPAPAAAPAAAQYAASAKKKGKAKKRKGGGSKELEDDGEVPPAAASSSGSLGVPPPAPAWVGQVQEALSRSLLKDFLRQDAWVLLGEDAAEERLEELGARLTWSDPLGMQLPLEWKDFVGLEVDGGPRRTSKRGTPQWILRLQKNVPWLLANYVTLVFLMTLLHALSNFGMLLWAAALQAGLLLAPPKLPRLQAPVRALLLQASHLLLWLLFVRSIWQMHMLVKLLLASLVAGHAYVVDGLREEHARKLAELPITEEREEAFATVFKLLDAVLAAPEDGKKRRLRKANEAFHRRAGRHAAAVDFLRAAGFGDADDEDAAGHTGKDALLLMPVAYISRLTDAHHTLARVATEAGLPTPALPGGSFNPFRTGVQRTDAVTGPSAPNAWRTEAERLRGEVRERERELRESVEAAPAVRPQPTAFWLSAGRRLEDAIAETAAQPLDDPDTDKALLCQLASAKAATSGTGTTFESADKRRLAELSRAQVRQTCVLRVLCPDKSALQLHFRAADTGEQVTAQVGELLAPHVRRAGWYLYQSPPLRRLAPRETLADAGLTPGANLYLGFDSDRPAPPYLDRSLAATLGPRPQDAQAVAEGLAPLPPEPAEDWGKGQALGSGGSSASTAASVGGGGSAGAVASAGGSAAAAPLPSGTSFALSSAGGPEAGSKNPKWFRPGLAAGAGSRAPAPSQPPPPEPAEGGRGRAGGEGREREERLPGPVEVQGEEIRSCGPFSCFLSLCAAPERPRARK